MSQQAEFVKKVISPWAAQNGLSYSSADQHRIHTLVMTFQKLSEQKQASKA